MRVKITKIVKREDETLREMWEFTEGDGIWERGHGGRGVGSRQNTGRGLK